MPQADNTLRLILPGRLIDGVDDQVQEGMAVAVQGNAVRWVGPASEAASLDSGGAEQETLVFPGGTLLPGLFDIHTHTNMPGDGRTGEEVHQDNDEIRLLRSARNTAAAVASGVTTMCDCGSWNRTGFALKEGLAEGLVEGPRVLVSGPPITVTDGHLWYMGGEADGVDGVRDRARHLIEQGADFIKIAASGGSTLSSDPYRASYTVAELTAIVGEAHKRDRPVSGALPLYRRRQLRPGRRRRRNPALFLLRQRRQLPVRPEDRRPVGGLGNLAQSNDEHRPGQPGDAVEDNGGTSP